MVENGPATRPAIAASAAAHVAPYLRTTDDAAVVDDGTRRHDRTEKKVVGRRTFAISIEPARASGSRSLRVAGDDTRPELLRQVRR